MTETVATETVVEFELNGQNHYDAAVPTNVTLAEYLHKTCGLDGARIGCSRGVCGACTVLIDGRPVAACSTFTFQVDGARVTTIEGLSGGEQPNAIQQAFIDNAAFQCGYCTAGMILITTALLTHHPSPNRGTIVDWISSNVCRCAGYPQIIAAVEDAARRLREAK